MKPGTGQTPVKWSPRLQNKNSDLGTTHHKTHENGMKPTKEKQNFFPIKIKRDSITTTEVNTPSLI
jgi:hypothetical protein